jgi:hypothetical protein
MAKPPLGGFFSTRFLEFCGGHTTK